MKLRMMFPSRTRCVRGSLCQGERSGGQNGVALEDPIVFKGTPGIACGVNVPIVVVACPQIIPRVQHDAQHELVTSMRYIHTHDLGA